MKPGLYTAEQISMERYTADDLADVPSLSSSIAHVLMTRSSLHAKWAHPRLSPQYEQKEAKIFDIGKAAHGLLLERSDANVAWIHYDDYRSKAAREEQAAAKLQGRTPILAKYQKPLGLMVAAAMEYIDTTEFAGIFDKGHPEVTGLWQEGDVWCRMRIDWLADDRRVMLNYKTTETAEPNSFIRRMPGLGYDLSAAHYERGMKVLGHRTEEFFLAQETSAPYACKLIGLTPAMRDIGERKRDEALQFWGNCLKTGKWSGYGADIAYAEPTSWQLDEHEEKKLTFEDRLELTTA